MNTDYRQKPYFSVIDRNSSHCILIFLVNNINSSISKLMSVFYNMYMYCSKVGQLIIIRLIKSPLPQAQT